MLDKKCKQTIRIDLFAFPVQYEKNTFKIYSVNKLTFKLIRSCVKYIFKFLCYKVLSTFSVKSTREISLGLCKHNKNTYIFHISCHEIFFDNSKCNNKNQL